MKLFKKIIVVILVFAAIFLGAYAYFGGLNKLEFKVGIVDEELVVYKEMIGSYGKSGDLMKLVGEELKEDFGINAYKGIGIYYDDPAKVEEDKLRSEIGSIIKTDDKNKIEGLKKAFLVKTLPQQEYLWVDMPLKGFFSVIIGDFKVYPRMEAYLDNNGYIADVPIVEIYDNENRIITYRAKLDRE